ncbi:hypothetical protein ACFX43_02990 [Nocardioides sp. YIM B13467]|uniref:hypothetical protein n=1 Tax=Nocardioides sp. YIM B13467 TaxID=3366294 RepID=UPI00366F9F43
MLRLIGRVATALAVTASMWAVTCVPANAQATDAVYGCGADVIDNESAYVSPRVRGHRLWRITTTREGSVAIKCGNGSTWGAVHVELKHEVPNWADALTCIKKTINRGAASDGENGKRNYTYRISGASIVVVVGDSGVVTAYPRGTGVVRKWQLCSAS